MKDGQGEKGKQGHHQSPDIIATRASWMADGTSDTATWLGTQITACDKGFLQLELRQRILLSLKQSVCVYVQAHLCGHTQERDSLVLLSVGGILSKVAGRILRYSDLENTPHMGQHYPLACQAPKRSCLLL